MIDKQEQTRVKASVTYPGEDPIVLIPVLTANPAAYIEGLLKNYEDAEIEVWEVDEHGHAISAATKAREEGKDQAVQQPASQPQQQGQKEGKPPPGMAQF